MARVLFLIGDVALIIITFGAYHPGDDGDGRRLQSLFASVVVLLLGLLFIGALVTGKLIL